MSCGGYELKDRMTPREKEEWYKHEDLDRFIRYAGIELLEYQRNILHTLAFKKDLRIIPARASKTRLLWMYTVILGEYEKYKKESQN